jgi:hypothetical protein
MCLEMWQSLLCSGRMEVIYYMYSSRSGRRWLLIKAVCGLDYREVQNELHLFYTLHFGPHCRDTSLKNGLYLNRSLYICHGREGL